MNECYIAPTICLLNNASFIKSYEVKLNNYKISVYLGINDTYSTVDGHLILNVCDINYINYTLGSGLIKQYTQLRGSYPINVPILLNTNLIKYTFGNIKEVRIVDYYSVIGKCVRRYTLTNYTQSSASGKNYDYIYLF
jgi:hypothetical protein